MTPLSSVSVGDQEENSPSVKDAEEKVSQVGKIKRINSIKNK